MSVHSTLHVIVGEDEDTPTITVPAKGERPSVVFGYGISPHGVFTITLLKDNAEQRKVLAGKLRLAAADLLKWEQQGGAS